MSPAFWDAPTSWGPLMPARLHYVPTARHLEDAIAFRRLEGVGLFWKAGLQSHS